MEPTTITDEFTATCPCGETVTYSGGREQSHTCRPISAQQVRDAWAAGYAFARREAAMAASVTANLTTPVQYVHHELGHLGATEPCQGA